MVGANGIAARHPLFNLRHLDRGKAEDALLVSMSEWWSLRAKIQSYYILASPSQISRVIIPSSTVTTAIVSKRYPFSSGLAAVTVLGLKVNEAK